MATTVNIDGLKFDPRFPFHLFERGEWVDSADTLRAISDLWLDIRREGRTKLAIRYGADYRATR